MLTFLVFCCIHTLVLHPGRTSDALLPIWTRRKASPGTLNQVPLYLPRILHDHDPLHLLRRPFQ
jgi:hypothetical protein